ncbi:DLW-39 family protein [Propionicicella superfundia]|nr:DLW-39 family protein [Propionicicella superfundia]
MKKLLVLVGALTVVVVVILKVQNDRARAEAELWAEATAAPSA